MLALSTGTKLGPYEILAPLGAGGMGEVYRARDTRLERTVAIKVLKSQLTHSSELRTRFEREAKVVSQLQHPHICVLHDVGRDGATDFLVMEFLEGESLSNRLKKGPLATPELLKIAMEIADALDKAHRAGVIHRDLKPANVMVTKTGAKLLDFGLAKPAGMAAASGAGAPLLSAAVTTSSPSPQLSPLTTQGAIIGTIQYMSPEQIEGKEADARSDIFAFGAMLYEMATGKRAFDGKSQISVASAILEKDPEPISALQPMSPPALEHVVRTCLAKDPELRWHTAHACGWKWHGWAEAGSRRGAPPARLFSRRWTWVAALLAAAGLALGYSLQPQNPSPLIRTSMRLPEGVHLEMEDSSLALSPDGRWLAFAGVDRSGKQQLWLRSLDSLTAQPLAGTEGATYPCWSPDSRFVGFFASHLLKKLDVSSGIVQALCDAADGRGASWGRDDIIVFSAAPYSPLYGVSAAGGIPSQLTTLSDKK